MNLDHSRCVYLLPGRGGRLDGLGSALSARGCTVVGRELVGPFARLAFSEQVDAVVGDLRSLPSPEEALVVAFSMGAYLFLHAQLQWQEPFPGRVLLLSPIVSGSTANTQAVGYVPPGLRRLRAAIDEHRYPSPKRCEVHVGEHDWQSNPDAVAELCTQLGFVFHKVAAGGHRLDESYVADVLDAWLASA
jgi:pimeloyl-ACP methyl ester carboxylesterase